LKAVAIKSNRLIFPVWLSVPGTDASYFCLPAIGGFLLSKPQTPSLQYLPQY